MEMNGRGFHGDYRFGYQGSEKDNEVSGDGNSYTTEFRQLDPRLGRWFSVDPVFQPWQSPYTSMDNNPIGLNDPLGNETAKDDASVGGENSSGDNKYSGGSNSPWRGADDGGGRRTTPKLDGGSRHADEKPNKVFVDKKHANIVYEDRISKINSGFLRLVSKTYRERFNSWTQDPEHEYHIDFSWKYERALRHTLPDRIMGEKLAKVKWTFLFGLPVGDGYPDGAGKPIKINWPKINWPKYKLEWEYEWKVIEYEHEFREGESTYNQNIYLWFRKKGTGITIDSEDVPDQISADDIINRVQILRTTVFGDMSEYIGVNNQGMSIVPNSDGLIRISITSRSSSTNRQGESNPTDTRGKIGYYRLKFKRPKIVKK